MAACGAAGSSFFSTRPIFSEFRHQPRLVLQPARRVDEEDIGAVRAGLLQRIEGERRGIGARRAGNHRGLRAFAPDPELFDGGGAKRVAGGKHDLLALAAKPRRELADGGGLAGAVDTGDQDTNGLCAGSTASGFATGASTPAIASARSARTSSSEISLS